MATYDPKYPPLAWVLKRDHTPPGYGAMAKDITRWYSLRARAVVEGMPCTISPSELAYAVDNLIYCPLTGYRFRRVERRSADHAPQELLPITKAAADWVIILKRRDFRVGYSANNIVIISREARALNAGHDPVTRYRVSPKPGTPPPTFQDLERLAVRAGCHPFISTTGAPWPDGCNPAYAAWMKPMRNKLKP